MRGQSELGMIPPSDVDMERAVIGAVLNYPNAIDILSGILTPEMFYNEEYGEVFGVIVEMNNRDEKIDILTVSSKLSSINGIRFRLAQCLTDSITAVNADAHAKILKQFFIAREIIKITTNLRNRAYEEDVADVIADFISSAEDVSSNAYSITRTSKFIQVYEDMMADAISKRESRLSGKQTGVATGFSELDDYTGGFQDTDLVILAARPAMGKTAVVLNFLKSAAKQRKNVLIFSLEMEEKQLMQRIISGQCDVSPLDIRTGKINDGDLDRMISVPQSFLDLTIEINDKPAIPVEEISAEVRRKKLRGEVDAVYIDYLQLVTTTVKKSSREQEVAYISGTLKKLAKDCNIPVIALAQLNRGVEHSADKRPKLSDLRESGSIEQDADIVMFVHRPVYYDDSEEAGVGHLIISKHRAGACGDVKFYHNDAMTEFWSQEDDYARKRIKVPVDYYEREKIEDNEKFIEE